MSDYGNSSAREQLQALEARYDRSILHNSPAEMLRFYQEVTSLDFVERDNPAGTVTTRKQMLEMMEQVVSAGAGFGYKELISIETRIDELAVESDIATAIIVHSGHYVQIDVHGWNGIIGADYELRQANKWERIWKRLPEGWQLQSSRFLGPV